MHRALLLLVLPLALAASPVLAQDDAENGAGSPTERAAEPARGVKAFPLQPGRRWIYQVTFSIKPVEGAEEALPEGGDTGEHRLDVYVTEPLEVAGRLSSVVEYKLDQDLAQRSYYVVEEGFLRCVKRLQGFAENVKDFLIVPALPVLPEEVEVGQKWTWEGKAGPDNGKQSSEVLRREQVETPAGTFDAFVVQTDYQGEDDSRGRLTRWVAPGVGVVKEVSEVRSPVRVFRTQGVLAQWEKP